MCRMKKNPPIFETRQDGYHDPVEKQQVRRSFRQQTKSEKDRCRKPHEPRRLLFKEEAQPKNDREATKRYIQRFNFNQPAFFDDADVRQPNHSGDDRSSRTEAGTCDGDKRNGHGEYRKEPTAAVRSTRYARHKT